MLRTLKIENLAIIDSAELALDKGFVCLTGESGAGKSVLIDALLLLSGARASADLVRAGFDKAVVEAEFVLPETSAELDLLDGNELFLRREVTAEGRSRAMVNGVMVPNTVLAGYAEIAFEIHGQHGQQRLLRRANHTEIFDEQVGLTDRRRTLELGLEEFRAAFRAYWSEKDGEAQRLREIDFLELQLGEIDDVAPTEDDVDLERRLGAARNSETIRRNREELWSLLDHMIPDSNRALKLLDALRAYDPQLDDYREQVASLSATLSDLQGDVSTRGRDFDQVALQKMEDRENALNKLFMKYGRDVNEVIEERARLAARLTSLRGTSSGLEQQWRQLQSRYLSLCEERRQLVAARGKGIVGFSKKVEKALRSLAMANARFSAEQQVPEWPSLLPEQRELTLPPIELGFQLAANAGEPLKPLARVASGGELSRVLLALISAFQKDSRRLLVFDEIDAGLGGETAHKVGRELAALGRRHQVLCVTHFAQVARFADHMIKLEKKVRGGRTRTSMVNCDLEQQIDELTRLMGGDDASEDLREHARKWLMAPAEEGLES